MKMKIKLMAFFVGLLVCLPMTSAWAGGGSTSYTYYSTLKVGVASSSPTGSGTVYASKDSTASSGSASVTVSASSSSSSTTLKAYGFAKVNSGFQFDGWSEKEDGSGTLTSGTKYTYTVTSSDKNSPGPTKNIYAVFSKIVLPEFSVTCADGNYTVNGGAPGTLTQTEAVTVTLASADPNFFCWKINGTSYTDNPHVQTFSTGAEISAQFLMAESVVEATTYEGLKSALANDRYLKITVPSGASLTVAKGDTLTVPAGKALVLNRPLVVAGTFTNNGMLSGSGKVLKVSYMISQGDVIKLYDGNGEECGNMDLKSFKPHYRPTTVTANAPSVTMGSNTGCGESWAVTFGGNAYTISKQSPKALKVTFDTAVAANHIKSIADNADVDSVGDSDAVLLADCSVSGYLDSKSRGVYTKTVDCAGKKATVSGNGGKIAASNALFLNGTVSISPSSENQNSKATFINCTSVTLSKIKGVSPAYGFYACGTKATPLSLSFGYYNSTRGENYRTAYFHNGYYKYTFNSTDDGGGKCVVKGGNFRGSDPTAYIPSALNDVIWAPEDKTANYFVVQPKAAAEKFVSMNGVEYESLEKALEDAPDNTKTTIELIAGLDLTGSTVTIGANKNIYLRLDKHLIEGNGKIVNDGTLTVTDSAANECTIACAFENHGTLDFIFGKYTGDIVNKAGALTVHNGVFTGSLTREAGAVNLKGGCFANDIASLVTADGYRIYSNGSQAYCVCEMPDGALYDLTVKGVSGYGATPYGLSPSDDHSADYDILAKYAKDSKKAESDYAAADWPRLAELVMFYDIFSDKGLDATLVFDRFVREGSLTVNVKSGSDELACDLYLDVPAGTPYRGLTEFLMRAPRGPYSSKTYRGVFAEEIKSVGMSVVDESDGANAGTVCTVEVELWVSERGPNYSSTGEKVTNTMCVVGSRRFTLGADSNVAMIRPTVGAATFYPTLKDACEAAKNGETVMLCNDCEACAPIATPCSFKFDTNGFAFTGKITADDCYAVETTDLDEGKTQYEVKLAQVTVAIPAVANTTLAVTASAGEVEDLGNGQYQVAPGAKITATYTPNEGFFGGAIVKTIESATAGASVTVSDDEAASVKAIVARIGDAPYASLAEAIAAAAELGETIDVVKESKLAVAEGVELTVTSGKLVAAVPADNVLELKDGTDATLTWPTVAGAADHIVVTGGRYSADPSAFLADGLEAKEKDGKYVVGVKVVIVIDEEQEATEENTAEQTVTTGEQTSTVEEEKVEEVIKEVVPEEQKETFVNNIKTNTKVEGVKLTTVDEVVIPDETKPEEKEVVKESGVKAVVLAAKAVAQETAVAAADKTDAEKTQAEKDAASFKAALEQKEKDVEITVKVEVKAKLVEYVPPANEVVQEAPKGTIKFELKPEAVVTVAVGDENPVQQVVPVSNEMIDQKQKIKVSLYAGFRPIQVLHRDDNGQLIEEFTCDAIGYDETTGIASVMISHFSTMELNEALVDPLAPDGATKIAAGFYQNATTYQDATEFYITSKNGFHTFRDLINKDNGVIDDYIAKGFFSGSVENFYQANPFKGKTVRLLCDVDEENVSVKPIGMTTHSPDVTYDKQYFYGIFDGCNNTISNLRIIDDPATADHRVGLFGYVVRDGEADAGVRNLTVENAFIGGYNYVGGFIGGIGGAVSVSNCHLIGSVTLSGTQYVGGMIGHVGDNVDAQAVDCSVVAGTGSVLTGDQSGGIIGYMGGGDVIGCMVKGLAINVKSSRVIGGIAGQMPKAGCVIKDCTVDSVTVTARTKDAAGSVAGSFGAAGQRLLNNTVVNTHVYDPESNDDPSKLVEKFAQCQFVKDGDTTSIVGWGIEWNANEKIIAGTFERIDDAAIAPCYEKVAQGTTPETWVVQEKVVAKIGETKYATLAEAFAAVTGGETVTLLANCELDANTSIPGKDVTITAVDPSISLTLKTGGYGGSGANVTFKDMKLIGVAQSSATQYTTGLIGVKKETYENCTLIGPFCTYGAASFKGCVFKSVDYEGDEKNLSEMPAPSPYTKMQSLWVYFGNCLVTVDNCKFLTYDRAVKIFGDEPKTFNVRFTNTDFYCQKKNKAAIMVGVDHLKETNIIIDEDTVIAHAQYSDEVEGGYALVYSEYGELNGGTSEAAYLEAHPEAPVRGQYAVGENIVLDESGKIKAGTFSKLVGEAIVAEGYEGKIDSTTGKIVVEEVKVAQIGDVKYATLTDAIAAAHEMTGDVTIELLEDVAERVVVHQKEGLNLTIDGKDKARTITGQILVDGNGRFNGTDTLTITGVNFTGTKADLESNTDAFVYVPSAAAYLTGGKYNYAHNVTIENCSFTGDEANPTSVVAFKCQANSGMKNLVMDHVTATKVHSLAQLTGVTNAEITDCTLTDAKNGVNISGGEGAYLFADNTFSANTAEGCYGIRLKDSTSAVATLKDGNTITAANPLVLGEKATETGNKGQFVVEGGTYNGTLSKGTTSADASYAISGGTFSEAPSADFLADGFEVVENDNGTYGIEPVKVAQIGETTYPSLQKAVDAADNGAVITLLDGFSLDEAIAVSGKVVEIRTADYNTADTPTVGLYANYYGKDKITANTVIYFKKNGVRIDRMLVGDFETAIAALTDINSKEQVSYVIALHGNVSLTNDVMLPTNDGWSTTSTINIKAANCTFDLNGHSLTQKAGTGSSNPAVFDASLGEFTLKDSSEEKTGLISAPLRVLTVSATDAIVNIADVDMVYGAGRSTYDIQNENDKLAVAILSYGTVNLSGNTEIACDESLKSGNDWALYPAAGEINVESGFYDGVVFGNYTGYGNVNITGGKFTSGYICGLTADGYLPANDGNDLRTVVPEGDVAASITYYKGTADEYTEYFLDFSTATGYADETEAGEIKVENGASTDNVPEGWEVKADPTTGETTLVKKAVCKIVETGVTYPTLQEAFAAAGKAKNVTIELLSDVDLAGVEWPLVHFNGTFDGKGYAISNLNVAYSEAHSGFIRYSDEGAVVKNVTFKDSTITGNRASVVIGYGYGCTAENVTVDGAVITGVQKCGGIIALVGEDSPLTIKGCMVKDLQFKYAEEGKNEGSSFGGLVGYVNYGVNAVITGNEVSGISFVGAVDQATLDAWIAETGYSLDKASQWVCHPFIAAVMGTELNTSTTPVSVTLADNEVEQVEGLLKGPTTTEYLGFFYRDGTSDIAADQHVVDITVDGVLMPNRAVAQIGETKYYSIHEAFVAVNSLTGTDEVTIKILRDAEDPLKDDYTFNKDVVIDSDVEGGVTLDFVSFDWSIDSAAGKHLTVTQNVRIRNLGQFFGSYDAYLYGDAEIYQIWAFCGKVNIMPGAKVKMLTEMIKLRYNGTLNVTGTDAGYDSANKQLSGGYVWADYTKTKAMNLKDTYVALAHVGVDDSHGAGAFDLALDNATLELGDSTGVSYGSAGGTISLKNGSLIIAGAIKNVTTITIDGASYGTAPVKVIDYTGSAEMTLADYGTVTVTGDETYEAYVESNDLWVQSVVKIGTPSELVAFAEAVNGGKTFAGKKVILTADLDMTGIDFQPIGNVAAYPSITFKGTFDGQNHKISNLKASDFTPNYATAGLFGSLGPGAVVQNLTLVKPEISSSHYAGAIVGYISEGPVKVINCSVEGGSVTSTPELIGDEYDNGDKVGGILGYGAGVGNEITECSIANMTITAYRDIGGIAGYANATGLNGNSVSGTTIVQDNTYAYKSSPITTVGEIYGGGSNVPEPTVANTTSEVEIVKVDPVAEVVSTGKKFATVQEAIDAAEDGAVVMLISDISYDYPTASVLKNGSYTASDKGKTLTLDLNGHAITAKINATFNSVMRDLIYNNGDLTVQDSVGTGSITITESNDTSWGQSMSIFGNTGKLTILSGTYCNNGAESMSYVVDNRCGWCGQGAELEIVDGVFKCPIYTTVRAYQQASDAPGTQPPYDACAVYVSGGTFEGKRCFYLQQPNSVALATTKVDITGGSFTAAQRVFQMDVSGLDACTFVNISDGEFACADASGNSIFHMDTVYADEPVPGSAVVSVSGGAFACGQGVVFDPLTGKEAALAGEVSGGIFSADPSEYVAEGCVAVQNTDAETSTSYPWMIGIKVEGDKIALELASESHVGDAQFTDVPGMSPDEKTELVDKISQNTEVVGVKLTTEAEKDESGVVITPSGVQAVIDKAKENEAFAAALAESTLVTVKVDVVVTPVAYTKPTEAAKAGSIKFKLEPRAIVSVNGKVVDPQTVPVTNEMIDQSRNISVSLYTGFRPAVITHDDDDGSRIETFGADGIDYDEATGVATVRISHFSTMTGYGDVNDVPAAKVYVAKIGETPYETLAEALDAAVVGNTVTLLRDIEGVTETFEITKAITIDGNGHKIIAAANENPRDVINAYMGARVLFQVSAADGVTFRNLTVDGGETHYYTFLAEAKGGDFTVEDTRWLHGGEASVGGVAGVGYGAAIRVNGGNLLVDGAFHANSGGKSSGVFPFTGILYDDGGIHFNGGVTATIGDDLLLVGMTGAPDVSTEGGKAYVEELLAAMNVPAGFAPYTLKLGDDSSLAFTGASPLGWNDIIDYGKQIMDVAAEAMGYGDLNKETTPVEVGLLTDTVLPDTFTFADTNFTVNGNGNALSGTIEYTDEAGQIENVELGKGDKPLVLDMTEVTKPVQLGDAIVVNDLVIKMTPAQAVAGTPVVTWPTEEGVEAPANEEGVRVQLFDPETKESVVTEEPVELIWDDKMGLAYIGPVEARLTGPDREQPLYTSLAEALDQAAQSGDTVALMMDIENFTGTIELDKSLIFDGNGHKIVAKPVTTHRDIFSAYIQSRSMLKLKTGAVTLKNITLDGDASHAYTYLVSADNSSVSLTTENVRLVNGGELMGNENGEAVGEGAGYGAAVHLNNGATMVVKDGFYACTGGTTDGVFPFTGILVDSNGVDVSFDLTEDSNETPTVGIGGDLLLVGMPVAIDAETAQGILDEMKVPTRFIPYTLTLGDGSAYAFTGASPLGWNEIIDYGKKIMDASASMGYKDLNKVTTPVEVGLLTDTVLPDTFTFADTNFTVNGNGNALSGTIEYTDKAGEIENIELGTEDQPLVLDMTKVENPVHLGGDIKVTDLVIMMTEEQATAGTPVVTWTADAAAPEGEEKVTVQLVEPVSSEPTGKTKDLIWDEELHIAYIGPAEVRLTGPTHDQPIYTTLTAALAAAEDGDAIKLLEDVALTDGVTFDMNVTLDLAGKEIGGESAAMTVGEGKTLTINDSSEEGSGVVASALVNDGGKLVITSGTFEKSISASEKVTDSAAAFALSGGTYSEAAIHLADDATVPLNDVCVEGYEAVYNGNYTWSVVPDRDTVAFVPKADDPDRIEVTFDDGTDTKVPMAVSDAWVRENFEGYYGTEETKPAAAAVNALLDTTAANGLKVWQNYLLGFDGSRTENPLTPDYRSRLNSAADEMITVIARANISLPAIDTGIVATFRLMQSTDRATWTQVGADASTPEFSLDMSELPANTYYKIQVVFSSSAAVNE